MSTTIAATSSSGTSSDGTVVNMAALARLEKLERSLGQQLKAALAAVAKNPLDSASQEEAANLEAQFAAVQQAIASLLGASTIKQKSSLGAEQVAEIQSLSRSQMTHRSINGSNDKKDGPTETSTEQKNANRA
jgi:hypothetical protein